MLFGFRFQYKQGYQSGRGKDAIAFSEQMIVGYDILLMAKGMGKFFEGGGRGNVKWMVYKEVAIVAIVAIVACRNCRNLIIRHDECINNYFIIL